MELSHEPRDRLGNWNAEFIPQDRSHARVLEKRQTRQPRQFPPPPFTNT